jgi:hypothetical protein
MVSYAYPDSDLTGEPTLDEMFADPLVRLVMKRDGVEEGEMRGTLDRIRDAYKTLTDAQ